MKPITFETFLEYRYVSDPRWSAQGRWISYWVRQADWEKDRYQASLRVMDRRGKEIAVPEEWRPTICLWAPESEELIFCMPPEQGAVQLCGFAPDSGVVTEKFKLPCAPTKIEFLDRDRLLLTLEEKVHPYQVPEYHYMAFTETPFWQNGNGISEGRRTHLYCFDIRDGSLTPICAEKETSVVMSAGCSAGVLYAATPARGTPCDQPGIYQWDLRTGETRTLLEPDIWFVRALGWLGRKPVFSGSRGELYGRYQWDGIYGLEGEEPELLCELDACVGLNSVLTDTTLGGGQTLCSRPDGLYFITTIHDVSSVYRLGEDGSLSGPWSRADLVTGFDVRAGELVYCGMKGQELAEIFLAGEERQLTQCNQVTRQYQVSVPEPVNMLLPQRPRIDGWVLKPTQWEPRKRYPAILTIHGGPRSCYSAVLAHEMQVWANRGYYVLYCNPRGSDSRGNAFGEIRGKYGSLDYQDLMDFTDAVLAQYPQIDPHRVGVVGGSYGGYMVNWMIGHTDRFRAAVSVRSIANWISNECISDIGYYYVRDQAGSSILTGGGEALWDNSPLKYAAHAVTPTLFIHAEEDRRCGVQEAFQMFYVLRHQGVESRLVIFQQENHGLASSGRPHSRVGSMKEIIGWLDRYLQ